MICWKTKDGKKIPLPQLSDDHLKNIIAMLGRKGHVSTDTFSISCAAAASLHGDMAQMYAEQEVASMVVNPALDFLEAEACRRGLL